MTPEEHYDRMFEKYYPPNSLEGWKREDTFGKNKYQTLARIKDLQLKGFKIKTGFQATSIVGYTDKVIFYKAIKKAKG